jgi:hypothetical protein
VIVGLGLRIRIPPSVVCSVLEESDFTVGFMTEYGRNVENSGKSQEAEASVETAAHGEPGKKTSRFAVASAACAFLAFCCLCVAFATWHFEFVGFAVACLVFCSLAALLGFVWLGVFLVGGKPVKGTTYAIVGIVGGVMIAGLLLGSFWRARQGARAVICMSNLHQLVVAIHIYEQAHDGRLPVVGKWCDLLLESDANLSVSAFKCPAARDGPCTYAFNKNLDGRRLSDVNDPAQVVLLFETEAGWNLSGGEESVKTRHESRMGNFFNVVFCDFSVGICREEQLAERPLRWKP